jgi:hypothetical protein
MLKPRSCGAAPVPFPVFLCDIAAGLMIDPVLGRADSYHGLSRKDQFLDGPDSTKVLALENIIEGKETVFASA